MMKHASLLMLAVCASLCVAQQALSLTFKNYTGKTVNIQTSYWGELFCSPDNFNLAPFETKNISAGACAIRSVTSGNGASGLPSASGTKFKIVQDGGGNVWIREGE